MLDKSNVTYCFLYYRWGRKGLLQGQHPGQQAIKPTNLNPQRKILLLSLRWM